MRSLLVALGLIASTCGAFAQEFELPTLRGTQAWVPPAPVVNGWGGFYAGAQFGYTNAGIDFANSVNDLSTFIVRNSIFESIVGGFTTMGKASTNGGHYGWFVGYNQEWEGGNSGGGGKLQPPIAHHRRFRYELTENSQRRNGAPRASLLL